MALGSLASGTKKLWASPDLGICKPAFTLAGGWVEGQASEAIKSAENHSLQQQALQTTEPLVAFTALDCLLSHSPPLHKF